jgi:hypothetical protein
MNAARELLDDLALIGATVEPAGDRLILRAGPMAIPARLVNRVREAKADLIATLAGDEARGACIVKWLNQHPAPSAPGRCAWCGRPESPSAVVLPFGTEPGTHAWLHAECWPAWHQSRRRGAAMALRTMGITPRGPRWLIACPRFPLAPSACAVTAGDATLVNNASR